MFNDPDIWFLLAAWAFTITAYIVGLYQGKQSGRVDGFTECVESYDVIDRWALRRARRHADLKIRTVHWNELPKFLRKDALAQDWRRR